MPVVLIGLDRRFSTVALVDTGATETLIPMDFWELTNPAFVVGEVSDDLEAANGGRISVRYATIDLAIRLGNTSTAGMPRLALPTAVTR